jgi:hypothetical protein
MFQMFLLGREREREDDDVFTVPPFSFFFVHVDPCPYVAFGWRVGWIRPTQGYWIQ